MCVLFRLSPAVIVVMLFWLHIVPYIANGPLWYQLNCSIDNEQTYWWSTLLYAQNFYPTNLSNSVSLFGVYGDCKDVTTPIHVLALYM